MEHVFLLVVFDSTVKLPNAGRFLSLLWTSRRNSHLLTKELQLYTNRPSSGGKGTIRFVSGAPGDEKKTFIGVDTILLF